MNNILSEIQKRFDDGELIPAIAQSIEDGAVLMLAWMNQEALEKTISSKVATYWSRSRNQLWVKGETSGNSQQVKSISYDCDGDAILIKVLQTGPACHTGESSCFHNPII